MENSIECIAQKCYQEMLKHFPEINHEGGLRYYQEFKPFACVDHIMHGGKYDIVIGPKTLHNENIAKGVIAHELAHVALGLFQFRWYHFIPVIGQLLLVYSGLKGRLFNTDNRADALCEQKGLGDFLKEARAYSETFDLKSLKSDWYIYSR